MKMETLKDEKYRQKIQENRYDIIANLFYPH